MSSQRVRQRKPAPPARFGLRVYTRNPSSPTPPVEACKPEAVLDAAATYAHAHAAFTCHTCICLWFVHVVTCMLCVILRVLCGSQSSFGLGLAGDADTRSLFLLEVAFAAAGPPKVAVSRLADELLTPSAGADPLMARRRMDGVAASAALAALRAANQPSRRSNGQMSSRTSSGSRSAEVSWYST